MAMSVRYHSIDGEILYQSGAAGRIDYLPDALGNVMATTKPNQPGVVDNTYRYKPYGDRLAKTGTGIDPKYQWVGTRTYRDTSLAHSSHYMVHRHYAEEEGRWTTVDPITYPLSPYAYVGGSPTTFTDIHGLDRDGRPFIVPIIIPPYRPMKCSCKPKPHVLGADVFPGAVRNCITAQCQSYCDGLEDPDETAMSKCPIPDAWDFPVPPHVWISIAKCRQTNDQYKPCTVINNPKWWKKCGEQFSIPGQGLNTGGANANQSNYPKPKCQIDQLEGSSYCYATGEFCCVECRMRVCCATGSFNDFIERMMIAQIKSKCFGES